MKGKGEGRRARRGTWEVVRRRPGDATVDEFRRSLRTYSDRGFVIGARTRKRTRDAYTGRVRDAYMEHGTRTGRIHPGRVRDAYGPAGKCIGRKQWDAYWDAYRTRTVFRWDVSTNVTPSDDRAPLWGQEQ